MTPTQLAQNRVKQFEELHDAFYAYFTSKLSKDSSKFNRYRLQLLTVYWDDLELTQVVYPLFQSFSCTLAEKQAVARAALYDALVAHTFSEFLSNTASTTHARMDALEKASGSLLTKHEVEIVDLKKQIESLKNSKEPHDAIPEGKQVVQGPTAGDEKQTDGVGPRRVKAGRSRLYEGTGEGDPR